MTGKALGGLIAAVIGLIICCAALAATVIGGGPVRGCPTPSGHAALSAPPGGWPPIGEWNSEQVGNAALIIKVGQRAGIPPRGWVIAVATAMQESSLRNKTGGPDDSLGLFQQRPSQGWGTQQQIMDREYAARAFYQHLVKVDGWQTMPLAQAAQAVQKSRDGGKYAKREKPARHVVAVLTGNNDGLAQCPTASVGPSGWAVPVRGPITSAYGRRGDGFHAGTDIGVPKGTKVHAAASGTVSTMQCNARRAADKSPYSCDVDGSPNIEGCGWYIDIKHADGILTRYCHLRTRPYVKVGQNVAAGQLIGLSGNSGNTSGPHLHYEVHVRGRTTNPEPFMAQRGVPLGR